MEILTAQLIQTDMRQRFYKLNHKLTKGISSLLGKEVDILESLKTENFKPEYQHLCPDGGVDIICVSDAHTHKERLVFGAFIDKEDGKCGRINTQIDGCHTMMIHGGDATSMKPDYVYIRRLAKLNGYQFHFQNLLL